MMNFLTSKPKISEIILIIHLSRMITETKKMKIGDPLDRSVQHGPQNHKALCWRRLCIHSADAWILLFAHDVIMVVPTTLCGC